MIASPFMTKINIIIAFREIFNFLYIDNHSQNHIFLGRRKINSPETPK